MTLTCPVSPTSAYRSPLIFRNPHPVDTGNLTWDIFCSKFGSSGEVPGPYENQS